MERIFVINKLIIKNYTVHINLNTINQILNKK